MSVRIDIDLLTLSYLYLAHKSRKTHKKYTIVDVLYVAEKILQRSEHKGGGKKKDLLHFTDGHVEFNEKIIS